MRKEKYAEKYPPIIAIDFDGTISKYTFGKFNILFYMAGPNGVEIDKDWVEVIKKLHQTGAELILYTCREGFYLERALSVLKVNGILECFGSINSNTEKQLKRYNAKWQPTKPIADFYIDDLGGLGSDRNDLLNQLIEIYLTDTYLNKEDTDGK